MNNTVNQSDVYRSSDEFLAVSSAFIGCTATQGFSPLFLLPTTLNRIFQVAIGLSKSQSEFSTSNRKHILLESISERITKTCCLCMYSYIRRWASLSTSSYSPTLVCTICSHLQAISMALKINKTSLQQYNTTTCQAKSTRAVAAAKLTEDTSHTWFKRSFPFVLLLQVFLMCFKQSYARGCMNQRRKITRVVSILMTTTILIVMVHSDLLLMHSGRQYI